MTGKLPDCTPPSQQALQRQPRASLEASPGNSIRRNQQTAISYPCEAELAALAYGLQRGRALRLLHSFTSLMYTNKTFPLRIILFFS